MMVSAVPVNLNLIRTHTSVPIERIPWASTVGRELGKRPSAQRFPAFS